MGYSVTKAAGLQLMKCLAATQGAKLRINAVLPGLLLTEWGLRYSEARIKALKERAVLKMEVSGYSLSRVPEVADKIRRPTSLIVPICSSLSQRIRR